MMKSFGQTYKDVKYIKAALSTWSSTSRYFGFDTVVYYDSDPVSYFKLNLTILPNSQFLKIGFSVLLIAQDLNTVINLYSFYMDQHNTPFTKSVPVPTTSYSAHRFFESMNI